MKTVRTFLLCMFMSLILLVVPAIFAQDETFGLSEADFELFTTASAITAESESLTFDFTVAASVTGTDEDVSLDVSGTGVVGGDDENPMFSLALTGEAVEAGEATPIDVEIRLVGDTIYTIDNTSDQGWQGQSAEDLFAQFGQMAGSMTGMSMNPEDLTSGDLSGLSGMEGMADAMAALSELDPSEFITITRSDADGLAQFSADLSISDLLSSPALAPMFMMGMSGGASMEGMEMSEEQMQAMTGMFAAMFSEATVSFDQYIDPETSLLHRAVLDINLPISGAMMGSSSNTTVAFNFDLNLSGFGEPVSVEAPADAVMVESN